jgi:RNA polymerase sigma-70 factor (ECF subfamily)
MGKPVIEDLIISAQGGCADAAGSLYECFHERIYRYLYYRTSDPQTAEDLTAEVFLKMVQALPGYRALNASFQAWLFQIARNLVIDHYRRTNNHQPADLHEQLAASDEDLDQVVENSLSSVTLSHALTLLNDEQRDVILLRFIDGMPIAEVAQALHKSENAIKGLQHRALITLREILDHKEVFYA